MIHLETLGGLAIRDSAGQELPGASGQPKRLALLAYLALAGPSGYARRDTVVSLFWPESDQEHARGSLRQALAFLRRTQGEVILTRGEGEIGINPQVLSCDARRFVEDFAAGRLEQAMSLYRGEFLAGVFVTDASPDLERWIDEQRAEFRRLACELASRLAVARKLAGDLDQALKWARRAAAFSPYDEAAFRHLIEIHDAMGDRAGALEAYDAFARRLAAELEIEPSPETQRRIHDLRARGLASVAPRVTPDNATSRGSISQGAASPPRSWGVRAGALIAAAGVILAAWAVTQDTASAPPGAAETPHVAPASARNAFVRGQYHLGRRDTTSIRLARDEFALAIDEDPDFADAYAALAYAYGAMAHYGMMPSSQAFARLEAAARRALQLQPDNGMALAQLASVESFQRWNWAKGERLFRDALAAAPQDADVHNLFGIHLRVLGRHDEAVYEMRRAKALEPITRHYAYQVGFAFLCAGYPDSALAEYLTSAELGVEPIASHLGAAEALHRLQRWDEALAHWATALDLSGDTARSRWVRSAHGRSGWEALRRVENENRLRRIQESAGYTPSTGFAAAHAALGHEEEALRFLRRGLSERDVGLMKIGCSSDFDPIRTLPEFRRIAALVGVPAEGARPGRLASAGR